MMMKFVTSSDTYRMVSSKGMKCLQGHHISLGTLISYILFKLKLKLCDILRFGYIAEISTLIRE